MLRDRRVLALWLLMLACSAEDRGGRGANEGGAAPLGSGGSTSGVTTGGTFNVSTGGTQSSLGGSAVVSGGTGASGGAASANGGASAGKTAASGGTSAGSGGRGLSVGGASTGGQRPASGGGTGIGGTAVASGGTSTAIGGRAASGGGAPVTTVAVGGSHSGDATFYDPNGNGNCSFGTSVLGRDIAALNQPDYSMAAWCGACADVTGPKGTIRVFIQDRCPECKSGDLDLNPEAFDKIANHADGRVKISWTFVACDVTGPVLYHYKDGSSAGWTAIQVLNHRLPITKLEYSIDNGASFKPTERQEYNYFLVASGFGPNIVQVRITAADGQTLTDTLPIPSSDLSWEGQAQFR